MLLRMLLLAAGTAAVAGCGASSSDSDASTGSAPARTAAAPAQKTVFDPDLEALKRAKAVQKTVDDGAKAEEKAIDRAEEGKDDKDGGGS